MESVQHSPHARAGRGAGGAAARGDPATKMGREKSISLPTRHWQLCPEGQASSGKAEDTAPCVWKWQLCLQADAAGGVEQSHNIPTKEALTLQEQRAEPPSCSLHQDFGTRASSWGSAGFTKDGHGNARERGCGRAAQIPCWAGVATQQSSNEDTTPWAQVKPRIKELVHPRTLVTCKRRSTPKLGFIQHSLTECPKAEST